jgi:hypothetical protein
MIKGFMTIKHEQQWMVLAKQDVLALQQSSL